MRRVVRGIALGCMVGLVLACTGKDEEPVTGDSETEPGPDPADSDPVSDDTSFGDDFDLETPSLTVQLDGAPWTTDEGLWFGSNLSATVPDASESQNLNIEVDGELKWAGTYTVTSMSYSLTPSQASPVVYDMASGDVTLTVLGFSGDNENLFGTLDGSATLSDGSTDIAFEGGEIRNWGGF